MKHGLVKPPSMIAPSVNDYRNLSLRARVSVALLCFERYCQAKGLQHPMIYTFLDQMWELPCMTSFPDWESHKCELIHVGIGDPFPCEIADLLTSAGISEQEFRKILESTVEIIYGSAYAKSDDDGSLRFLGLVFDITSSVGVSPPSAQPFLTSLFSDRHGWGVRLSPDQRDEWRFRAYDTMG